MPSRTLAQGNLATPSLPHTHRFDKLIGGKDNCPVNYGVGIRTNGIKRVDIQNVLISKRLILKILKS